MSDEELRDRINKIAVEIENLEVTAKKKEEYVRNRISEEFDPKIREVESKLGREQSILDQILKSIEELQENKKNKINIVKDLEHELNALKKEKEKYTTEKCRAISKEKKMKTKVIDRDIKLLEKELKSADKK